MAESLSEYPTISQTLHAVHASADLLLVGRKIALEALKEAPYIPEPETFVNRIWDESGVDFWSLTGGQRLKISAQAGFMYNLMLKRAQLQEEWMENPTQVMANILENVCWETGGKIRLDPSQVDIEWGLFSFAIVAGKEAFSDLKKLGPRGAYAGFVSGRFTGPLGAIPVVLRDKEVKLTKYHEDIHILQGERGELYQPFDWRNELENPSILRAADNTEIRPEDLAVCKRFLTGMCNNARHELEAELRAFAWERTYPYAPLLDESEHNLLDVALVNVYNATYASASALSEKERVKETYTAILQIVQVDHYRKILWAYVEQAVKERGGGKRAWEWAASAVAVLPIGSSLPLFGAVMIGRGKKLEIEPKLDTTIPLPRALIIHARRLVNPTSYGQGEEVSPEQVDEFLETVVRVFDNRSLYEDICQEYGIGPDDLQKVRQKLIKYAAKSVPKGFRGKTKRLLQERLH